MRDLKFRYIFQHEDTGRILAKTFSLTDIQNGNYKIWHKAQGNRWYLISIDEYTGLHDKNGKEIYEGDILGGNFEGGYIYWCNRCKSFEYFSGEKECFGCNGDLGWWEIVNEKNIEVIGNIYEK